MGIKDWLRMAKDVKDSRRLRSQIEASRKELLHHRNRVYEMATGDAPTISNIRSNGHESEIGTLDDILHDVWVFHSFNARPEAPYSVKQVLPGGEIRTVISGLPSKFDAQYLQNLLIILDKKNAAYEIVEDDESHFVEVPAP